jgi:probable F420-dependent oxidoreductase
VARKADELGYDSMWMGHHVVFGTEISATYPYSADGRGPHHPRMDRLDPWTLFAHLSAITRRLRFATGVYLLPLVNPFVTARAVGTADVLSGGRMIVGIGVGWNQEEYEIVGEDFTTRGERADEILDILRKLWSLDTIEHHGRHYEFGPVHFEPKPVQRPHPPFLGGGASPAALRRAAVLDGCYLPAADLDVLKAPLAEISRLREEAGLAAQPYDITVGMPVPLTREALHRFEEVGVTRVVFEIGANPLAEGGQSVPATAGSLIRNLEQVAEVALA